MRKVTFGVIVTNRNFFPKHLVIDGRRAILDKLEKMGYGVVALSENETPMGAVETFCDAKKCAELFKRNSDLIAGIVVVLPNFGDEGGVSAAVEMARLNVPILIQACDDEISKLDLLNRRDGFCGKLSLCNNLYQRNIRFTNTTLHTCQIESPEFTKDLEDFAAVCRVVKGITTARIGAIGTRPNDFKTVRYSEKLLQASGITVNVVDLSEILSAAQKLQDSTEVEARIKEIRAYGKISSDTAEEKIIKQAKLTLAIDKWVDENECDATAIQCWTSLQENYGCAACLPMSMMGEKGKPSACETDVVGALTMYALYLASGQPSAYLDWNNNYQDDRDMCINQHCSNFPKSFFEAEFEISDPDILSNNLGEEKCFGACKGQVAPGKMTFAKISTDDVRGKIKVYIGEGELLGDKVDTFGGVALCRIENLQGLMNYICMNGFEHHVAMNRSLSAKVLEEAFGKYLGWEVYRHG